MRGSSASLGLDPAGEISRKSPFLFFGFGVYWRDAFKENIEKVPIVAWPLNLWNYFLCNNGIYLS